LIIETLWLKNAIHADAALLKTLAVPIQT